MFNQQLCSSAVQGWVNMPVPQPNLLVVLEKSMGGSIQGVNFGLSACAYYSLPLLPKIIFLWRQSAPSQVLIPAAGGSFGGGSQETSKLASLLLYLRNIMQVSGICNCNKSLIYTSRESFFIRLQILDTLQQGQKKGLSEGWLPGCCHFGIHREGIKQGGDTHHQQVLLGRRKKMGTGFWHMNIFRSTQNLNGAQSLNCAFFDSLPLVVRKTETQKGNFYILNAGHFDQQVLEWWNCRKG